MVERLPVDKQLFFRRIIWYTYMCMPEKRTYADRAQYLIKAVANRRRKLKEMVVKYKGGKCVLCGYSKYAGAFDLHHKDDSRKSFGLSTRGLTRSWKRIKKEADKCILVCANCHREIHGSVTQLSRVIGIEKRGEFGKARKGNSEPSLGIKSRKV